MTPDSCLPRKPAKNLGERAKTTQTSVSTLYFRPQDGWRLAYQTDRLRPGLATRSLTAFIARTSVVTVIKQRITNRFPAQNNGAEDYGGVFIM
jgi:hypothetical protein